MPLLMPSGSFGHSGGGGSQTVWDGNYDGSNNGSAFVFDTGSGQIDTISVWPLTTSNEFATFYRKDTDIHVARLTVSGDTTVGYGDKTTVESGTIHSFSVQQITDDVFMVMWSQSTFFSGTTRYSNQRCRIVTWNGSTFDIGAIQTIAIAGQGSSVSGIDSQYFFAAPTNDAGTEGLFYFGDDIGSSSLSDAGRPNFQGWSRSGDTVSVVGSAVRLTTASAYTLSQPQGGMRNPGDSRMLAFNTDSIGPTDSNVTMGHANFNGASVNQNSGTTGNFWTAPRFLDTSGAGCGLMKGPLHGPSEDTYVAANFFGAENDSDQDHGPRLFTAVVDTTGSGSINFSSKATHTGVLSGSTTTQYTNCGGILALDDTFLMTVADISGPDGEVHVWERIGPTSYNRPSTYTFDISMEIGGTGQTLVTSAGKATLVKTAENNVLWVFGSNNATPGFQGVGAVVLRN